MKEFDATIKHAVGLHARPAARFVKIAKGFDSEIHITNTSRESDEVNAKSLVKVIKIAAAQNHEVHIRAEGSDEDEAAKALEEFLTKVSEEEQ